MGQCHMAVLLQQTETYQPKAPLCNTVSNTLLLGPACVPTKLFVRSCQPLKYVSAPWMTGCLHCARDNTYKHIYYIA